MPFTPKTPLFKGIAPNNNGYISNHDQFLNGDTEPYGRTFDPFDAAPDPENFVEVFAGTTPGVNDRIVSPHAGTRGGATQSIGFLSKKPLVPGMFEILVGTGPNTNGTATSDEHFQGEPTTFFGYALPS